MDQHLNEFGHPPVSITVFLNPFGSILRNTITITFEFITDFGKLHAY